MRCCSGSPARGCSRSAVGLVAGLALALYAPAIFFDSLIQKSVLDMFFVCARALADRGDRHGARIASARGWRSASRWAL